MNNINNDILITFRVPIKRKTDNFMLASEVSISFLIIYKICQYDANNFQVTYKNTISTVLDHDNAFEFSPDCDLCNFIENYNEHNINTEYFRI